MGNAQVHAARCMPGDTAGQPQYRGAAVPGLAGRGRDTGTKQQEMMRMRWSIKEEGEAGVQGRVGRC